MATPVFTNTSANWSTSVVTGQDVDHTHSSLVAPSAAVNGDVLMGFASRETSGAGESQWTNTPTGWTELFNQAGNGVQNPVAVYVATLSGSTAFNFFSDYLDVSGQQASRVTLFRIQGGDESTALASESDDASLQGGNGSIVLAGRTTSENERLVFQFMCSRSGAGDDITSITGPDDNNWISISEEFPGPPYTFGADASQHFAYQQKDTAGATGVATWDILGDGGTYNWEGFTFEVGPAAGAGAVVIAGPKQFIRR